MHDPQASAVIGAIMNLAVTMRDEGPDAVHQAATEVLAAAGKDAVAAITAAAALIRVDQPIDRWWQRPLPVLNEAPLRVAPSPAEPGVSLAKQPRKRLAPCGTHAAYVRHKARREPLDEACIAAERDYQRERYQRQHGHRATAHGRRDRRPVAAPADTTDSIAIERAIRGEYVVLTQIEFTVAVRTLTERGLSAEEVAERLHTTPRTVQRHRAQERAA